MGRNKFTISSDALERIGQRLADQPARLAQVRQRAFGTLRRRLPVLAGKLAAERVLNVRPGAIRGLLSVKTSPNSGALILMGLNKRIPLNQFIGTRYRAGSSGAIVKKWHDSPAETYDAARARSKGGLSVGGAFAIKGRGVKGGIWQRIDRVFKDARGRTRQVIVRRSGPSFATALADRKHGDIIPTLATEARSILQRELVRLTRGS